MNKFEYENELAMWRKTTNTLFEKLEQMERKNRELVEQKEQTQQVAVILQGMLHHYQNECITVELTPLQTVNKFNRL